MDPHVGYDALRDAVSICFKTNQPVVRGVIGIEFQKKKNVQSKTGYKATTALVADGGEVDDSDEVLELYEINDVLHEMITSAVNPK